MTAVYQLLLIAAVLSPLVICELTLKEYYVSPTVSTQLSTKDFSYSCPTTVASSSNCYTLTQYYTGNYNKSNTVFKLLPGIHHIETSLILYNLINLTIEAASNVNGEFPMIVLESIDCRMSDIMPLLTSEDDYWYVPACSTIYISDCDNIILRQIRIKSSVRWIQPLNPKYFKYFVAADISFNRVSNIIVEGVSAKRGIVTQSSDAVIISDSTFGEVSDNSHQPLLCDQTPNSSTDAQYGVFLSVTTNTVLSNVTAINTVFYGIYLLRTIEITLIDITSLYTVYGALIALDNAWYTDIVRPSLEICLENIWPAVNVHTSVNTTVTGARLTGGTIFLISDSINVSFSELVMRDVLTESHGVHLLTSTNITFQNCTFSDFKPPTQINTDVVSSPSIIFAYFSQGIYINDCVFTRNHIVCISARASNVTFSGVIEFSNNTASSGTAITIAKESNVTLEEDSRVVFFRNRAVSSGGAIYIATGEDELQEELLSQHWCFLHLRGSRISPRLTFTGNSAGKAGDVLYGGHLAIGYNGIDENCLQNFLNASTISESSFSTIASESSRVCLCNSDGVPDCHVLDWDNQIIYPGQTINVSVVAVGQAFGSVTDSVFAQFVRFSPNTTVPELSEEQYTQSVLKDHCNILRYTIFQTPAQPTKATLALTPQFKEISYYPSNNSVSKVMKQYRIWAEMKTLDTPFPKQILQCPLGFELRGSSAKKCVCSQLLQSLPKVVCDIRDETISRSGLVWIGVGSNDTIIVSEYCPLNYCKNEMHPMILGDYDAQCNYDHSGILCGDCRAGLSLALGTSQCLTCSNWYLFLILPFALAGILLVAFIKVINLTTAHGRINGLIFYVNIVKANEFIFLPQEGANPITLFISWTNLDLGIETCFFDGLSAYMKAWMQFLFPLYIWVIAGGIVVLSKYSSRIASLMGNNSVSVLATLFFLSYAKLLRIVIVGLSYTVIRSADGNRVVWSADGNIEYLGPHHAPLFVVCTATLLFMWLPYTLLLFCGQWLYKFKNRSVIRLLGKITPFLDAHYGPLKGRHRYWFGAQLLIRAAILLISSSVPSNRSSTIILAISVSAVVLTGISSLGFYRNKIVSLFELTFFLNLSLLGISTFFTRSTGQTPTLPAYTLITVALFQFIALVIYQLYRRFKTTKAMMMCCDWLRRKQGFQVMEEEEQEDDWETYEMLALEREREARKSLRRPDVRVNNNIISNDVLTSDSSPTY